MRVVVVLILLAVGLGPALAADAAERPHRRSAAERYYGPQLPLPGVAEQVVVERGPRILLEDDFFGLSEPVFATRRLPSRVSRIYVEAEGPLEEPDGVARVPTERRGARVGRRQGR